MILSSLVGRRRARITALFATVPFVALGVLGAAASAMASQSSSDHKVTYCHATHSAKNPFVVITTDKVAVIRGRQNHPDDIIPPFEWNLAGSSGVFDGLNWSSDGADFIASGCEGDFASGGDDSSSDESSSVLYF